MMMMMMMMMMKQKQCTGLVSRLNSPELHRRFFGGTVRFCSFHPQKTKSGKKLPKELSRNVEVLTCKSTAKGRSCHVYLVGTNHISQESPKQVQAIIQFLKPEVVFLELCCRRNSIILDPDQTLKVPTFRDMIGSWKKKHDLLGMVFRRIFAQIGEAEDAVPGSKFRVAYEEAISYGGKVILGGRHIEITFARLWANMSLWDKTRLMCSLPLAPFFIKQMKMDDTNPHFIEEMDKEFSPLDEILVHERDQYMSFNLLKVAREHRSVVAVVGKDHLPGMKKLWKQPIEELQLKVLLKMPSEKGGVSALKLVGVGVVVAGATIIYSFL